MSKNEDFQKNFFKDEIDYLNHCDFAGLKDIMCGDAMFYTLNMATKNSKGSVLTSLGRILKSFLLSDIDVCTKGQCEIGFLFSNAYGNRNDYMPWFKNVYSLCSSRVVIKRGEKIRVQSPHTLLYFIQWFNLFEKCFEKKDAFYYSSILFKYYSNYLDIIRIVNRYHLKLMVTLCDVHSIDSMVTQYCNKNGIPTATLEHGFMIASPALSLSKSDFFLGYGQCVLESALSVGMKESKFIKVGMPQLIGFDVPSKMVINGNKIIGVICNGGKLIDEDIEMLKSSIEFSQRTGYKVIAKLHPGSSVADYPEDLMSTIEKVYITEIDALDFAELAQFSIISSSSVFLEYLFHMYPVFHYPSGIGVFNRETWCEVNNADEIENKVFYYLDKKEEYHENAKRTLQYYTEYEDVAGNYDKFLKSFLGYNPMGL